ncbi:helix-turn-helix domain-containing protein [Pinisolibacter aquiterrae]
MLAEKEIAAELGVSSRTVKRWRAMPDGLPFIALGGRIFYRRSSVRSWIEGRECFPNRRRRSA